MLNEVVPEYTAFSAETFKENKESNTHKTTKTDKNFLIFIV